MRTLETSAPPLSPVLRSSWHSPVPYLLGGLAAMLGLIAFALLILACSYWKLSGYIESSDSSAGEDVDAGDGKESSVRDGKGKLMFEEKFLVIMAGQEKPTYLATPISSRATSFGSNSCRCETADKSEDEAHQKPKEGSSADHLQMWNMEGHETSNQVP